MISLSSILLVALSIQFIPVRGISLEETFCTDFLDSKLPPKLLFFKDDKIFGKDQVLKKDKDKPCMTTPLYSDANLFYHPQIYGIEQDSTNLNNWIHYELNFIDSTHFDVKAIDAILIQADTDKIAGFGQFVPISALGLDPGVLPSSPVPTQFMPCSHRESGEPLPSTLFAYTKDATKTPGMASEVQETLDLFWKFTQTLCNSHAKVTFRGMFIKSNLYTAKNKDKKTKLLKKLVPPVFLIPPITITLSNNFIGQAASVPKPGLAIDWNVNIRDSDLVPWLTQVEEDQETVTFPKHCDAPKKTEVTPVYGCGGGIPQCLNQKKLNSFVEKNHVLHPEYEDYVHHRLRTYCFCPIPRKQASLEPTLLYRDLSENLIPLEPIEAEPEKNVTGLEYLDKDEILVTGFPGNFVWHYRIVHGIAHVVSGLFITPMSIFLARNYKETFMKKAIIFNKLWFILHILSVFINFLLHLCGMFAIYSSKQLSGVSNVSLPMEWGSIPKSYKDHRMIGFANTILFMLLMLLGGIRSYNSCLRKLCITLHWFLGMVYYLSTLYLIVLSINIPGSPSDGRKTNGDKTGKSNNNKNLVALLVLIWISIDVGFHITMMVLSYIEDKALRIHRNLWIVPIPSLSEYNKTDLPGSFLRKILLFIYFALAVSICGIACVIVMYNPGEFQNYGHMSCSHEKNTTRLDISKLKDCELTSPFNSSVLKGLFKRKFNATRQSVLFI